MKVYFATKNGGKVQTLRRDLKPFEIEVVQSDIDLIEPRSDDVGEIARSKVRQAYEQIGGPCVAVDAGFYIGSLLGFPGAFVNHALKTIKVEGILKLMDGEDRRVCVFRQCLAYMDGLTRPRYFLESVNGALSTEGRGKKQGYHWSDLSRIFIPDGCGKTMSEMSRDEYDEWKAERVKENPSLGMQLGKWLSEHGKFS